jgi:hypothetical protein
VDVPTEGDAAQMGAGPAVNTVQLGLGQAESLSTRISDPAPRGPSGSARDGPTSVKTAREKSGSQPIRIRPGRGIDSRIPGFRHQRRPRRSGQVLRFVCRSLSRD